MSFYQLCVLFILLLSIFNGNLAAAADSPCQDWVPYIDEKCFKVIDDNFRTFEEAEKCCAKLDPNEPTLPIVQSKDEQDFISNYLFKTLKKVDNFWIGARFVNNSFKWIDNSDLSYTNWDSRGMKNKTNYCIQIQVDDVVQGKWIDESCEKSNKVVCQKIQTWSMARLQKAFLDERKKRINQAEALDEANKQIHVLEQNQENSMKNPVPIGFVYVQLPHQPEPKTLWSSVQWKDVTSEYAGMFFRAEGGGAAEFGTEQLFCSAENAPRVTQVVLEGHAPPDNCTWCGTTLNIGGPSSGIGIFGGSLYGTNHYTHRFYQSGGEVRPKNMAMRVWKRVA